ncbi:MAG: nicotinate-nucleotide--dimethylbenzimidazole phosphoribosyltransferase [Spongiibacteraceae bacterium]|nr:nicotinate-nucleotide--dimethylbenzimidazole phosphoribosyltransferase [Spongiibacteraceae bacterium]
MNEWYLNAASEPNQAYRNSAQAHTDNLTKPKGSLGALETMAITLAGLQSTNTPSIKHPVIRIFAADHGVAQEGVSAFPQAVTEQMVRNFSNGGAAICVLAGQINAQFQVVNVGTVSSIESLPNVSDQRVAAGTRNFTQSEAMDTDQLLTALSVGKQTVDSLDVVDCFIGGEMGIANTTSATAVACALLGKSPATLVGRGTGVTDDGLAHKTHVIEKALKTHQHRLNNPLAILQVLGGFDIAALCGAYICAAQQSIPVLVDGFICSVAALVAVHLNPSIRPWLLFSHQSKEAGHEMVLQHLQAQPLLKLGLCLGEGSGAATALPMLQMACAVHNEMASFDSAGVSRN